MSTILINLSKVIGLCLALISLVTGIMQQLPIWTVLFRSLIVLAVGSVVVMAFFRCFNMVLYRFLAEKLREHREREEAGEEEEVAK
jgi:hypothetical protein